MVRPIPKTLGAKERSEFELSLKSAPRGEKPSSLRGAYESLGVMCSFGQTSVAGVRLPKCAMRPISPTSCPKGHCALVIMNSLACTPRKWKLVNISALGFGFSTVM